MAAGPLEDHKKVAWWFDYFSMGLRAADISSPLNDTRTAEDVAQLVAARSPGLAGTSKVFLPPDSSTLVASSFLPRRDPRDVLILKAPPQEGERLRVAVSAHPNEPTLEQAIGELFPIERVELMPVASSTDPLSRMRNLFTEDTLDGAIAPKWLLDEILGNDSIDRTLMNRLNGSIRIVVPLSVRLPLPGQGAIALRCGENAASTSQASARIAANVSAEHTASARGDRMTIVWRNFGDVVWRRSAGNTTIAVSIERRTISLPKARSRQAVWPPITGETGELVRVPLTPPLFAMSPSVGLIISKAEALPKGVVIPSSTVVLVPGTTTWKKLAQRNVWVHGSFDGLGEEERTALAASFPQVTRWLKLGHTGAVAGEATELLPTYRLESNRPAPRVSEYTHFFWKSGSQFEYFLTSNPAIRFAWHGSGPGHTHAMIVRHIDDRARAGIFTGIDDFLEHVL